MRTLRQWLVLALAITTLILAPGCAEDSSSTTDPNGGTAGNGGTTGTGGDAGGEAGAAGSGGEAGGEADERELPQRKLDRGHVEEVRVPPFELQQLRIRQAAEPANDRAVGLTKRRPERDEDPAGAPRGRRGARFRFDQPATEQRRHERSDQSPDGVYWQSDPAYRWRQ